MFTVVNVGNLDQNICKQARYNMSPKAFEESTRALESVRMIKLPTRNIIIINLNKFMSTLLFLLMSI